MTPNRKIPENVYETPVDDETPDRPSGSWPRRIESQVNEIHGIVQGIDKTLRGTQEKPFGLVHEVEALKQSERGRKKIVMFAVFGTLSAVGTALWNVITGKAHP